MKRLYKSILATLFALVGVLSTQAASVTFNVADPSAITMKFNGVLMTNIVEGDNVIEYTPTEYPSISINANDGYLISSIKCDHEYSDLYVYNGMSASFYPSSSHDGYVYTVNTKNLAVERTATATIKVVDDYTKVRATRNGGWAITLTGEETEVAFIPGEESPFTFNRTDYSPLCRVKLNGNVVAENYGNHTVDVKDGDVIEIQANYPDVDVPVYFTLPENCPDIIRYVSVDYQNVSNYLDEGFTVKAGSEVAISLDYTNYSIKSIFVNDDEYEGTSYFNFRVGTEPTYVEIVAAPYGSLDFTVNVDDPSRLSIYPGSSTYGVEAFDLVAGENHLSIPERTACVTIKAQTGCMINSITDAEGNEVSLNYGVIYIKQDMVLNITTSEKDYDCSFIVYVDSKDNVSTCYWMDEDTRSMNELSAGYNVVKFTSAESYQYMISIYGQKAYIAYLNDELIDNFYNSSYFSKQFYPTDGDVYKVYTQGVAPELHNLSFTLYGEDAENVTVVTDLIKEQPAFADGLNVLTGTQVTVKAGEDSALKVTVDGEDVEADENGCYNFTATADHEVVVTSTSAIGEVAAPVVNDGPVYNLQGIKVVDSSADTTAVNALPVGVYVTNGKKFVVR